MNEPIELALQSPDGIIDCRLEPQANDEGGIIYAATILYPTKVAGYTRSDIYCHNLRQDPKTGNYHFDKNEEVHPKIKDLEPQLSNAIKNVR